MICTTTYILDSLVETSDTVVSLSEAKDHIHVTSTDDDTYFQNNLLPASQALVEQFTGLSLSQKTATILVNRIEGDFVLPFGPIISITSVTDSMGNVLVANTDYKLIGAQFKIIRRYNSFEFFYNDLTIVYQVGYDEVPAALKMAILNEFAFRNDNRGDQPLGPSLSPGARAFANPYRKISYIQ